MVGNKRIQKFLRQTKVAPPGEERRGISWIELYILYLMQIQWFRVILALVITPVIVLESSLWTVILRFYTR